MNLFSVKKKQLNFSKKTEKEQAGNKLHCGIAIAINMKNLRTISILFFGQKRFP